MPIYAYRCATCGHAKDVLRKISDPPLSTCPACGAETFAKQVTAAGFQLKGSGWYATDFRGGTPAAAPAAATGGESAAASPAPSTGGTEAASGGGTACGGSCACH
jgi:putative FmdB family regulatory protein